jgi:ribonuclease HI
MANLSPEGRRVIERLLAGDRLDDAAPPGDPVRAEVEAHLIATMSGESGAAGSPGAGRRAASRRAAVPGDAPPADLPADGRAVAFSDGASRGNPGPAAIGFRILAGDGTEIWAEGRRVGSVTNNVAEYLGAEAVLEKALELGLDRIELRLDSELVVKQLNGQYRVKQPALAVLKGRVDRLIRRFESFRVRHVGRAHNAASDRLANEALDGD